MIQDAWPKIHVGAICMHSQWRVSQKFWTTEVSAGCSLCQHTSLSINMSLPSSCEHLVRHLVNLANHSWSWSFWKKFHDLGFIWLSRPTWRSFRLKVRKTNWVFNNVAFRLPNEKVRLKSSTKRPNEKVRLKSSTRRPIESSIIDLTSGWNARPEDQLSLQ